MYERTTAGLIFLVFSVVYAIQRERPWQYQDKYSFYQRLIGIVK